MNATEIVRALGQVEDRYITDYIPSVHEEQQTRQPHFLRWCAVAACLVLLVMGSGVGGFLRIVLMGANGADPNWHEPHVQRSTVGEAVQTFGDDLLLERMAVTEVSERIYQEFVLEYDGVTPIAQRNGWKRMDCTVRYDALHDSDPCSDLVQVQLIFSQETDRSLYDLCLDEAVFDRKTLMIGDTEVECFYERVEADTTRSDLIRFVHDGVPYYISGTNDELTLQTVTQMLTE